MTPREKQNMNLKPPKKGEIRNPKGRPKGPSAATVISKWLQTKEPMMNPITKKMVTMTQLDAITLAQIAKARGGSTQAFEKLLDRTEGKPMTSVNMKLSQPLSVADKSMEELLEMIKQDSKIIDDLG